MGADKIRYDVKFCPYCGHKVRAPLDPRKLPECFICGKPHPAIILIDADYAAPKTPKTCKHNWAADDCVYCTGKREWP